MEEDPTKFLAAIKAGELTEVQEMLTAHPRLLKAQDSAGVSAVMNAVYHGQRAVLEYLLAQRPALTFWEAAAVGDSARLMAALDAQPALLDRSAPDGFSAAGLAAFFGQVKILRTLVSRGANVNIPAKNTLMVCPLHSAVAHRQPETALEMATILLAAGAAVNVAQQGGWTPLHQAAAHGHRPLVALLLAYGADQNARSADGRTPLDMAVAGGFDEVVVLLDEGE